MLFKFFHYSRALNFRFELLLEISRAKNDGKKTIKRLFSKIWREPHIHEEYIWLYRFIDRDIKINLIDVGGNSGYWSELFTEYFDVIRIRAFEPVKVMYYKYSERYKDNPKVKVFNNAIGEKSETLEINVAANYGLTSFNTYDEALKESNTQFNRKELVEVKLLDQFYDEIFDKIDDTNFLTVIKIDVQGYEDNVIKGGSRIFEKVDIVILECSFANEFKDKSPTFSFCAGKLNEFELYPIRFGCFNYNKGPISYERNALFVKKHLLTKIWGY